jgi:hypothetical protein
MGTREQHLAHDKGTRWEWQVSLFAKTSWECQVNLFAKTSWEHHVNIVGTS